MGMSANPILFFGMAFEPGHEFRPGEEFDYWDFNNDEYPVEIGRIGHMDYSYYTVMVKKSIIQHYDYVASVDALRIRQIGDMMPSSMTATILDFAREHRLNLNPETQYDRIIGPDWIMAASWG